MIAFCSCRKIVSTGCFDVQRHHGRGMRVEHECDLADVQGQVCVINIFSTSMAHFSKRRIKGIWMHLYNSASASKLHN